MGTQRQSRRNDPTVDVGLVSPVYQDPTSKARVAAQSSREARSNQRRLLTSFGEAEVVSDLLKFNQLKVSESPWNLQKRKCLGYVVHTHMYKEGIVDGTVKADSHMHPGARSTLGTAPQQCRLEHNTDAVLYYQHGQHYSRC